MTNTPTPFYLQRDTKTIYHKYQCAHCDKESQNTYCEPARTKILNRLLCFHCNYWHDEDERLSSDYNKSTIIDGRIYSPGNRTTGEFRGMAGRRFDIEYIGDSAYKGQVITTFDLWSGSDMPEKLRQKYPDTARFYNGAEKAQVGPTTCWNPSDTKQPPYKLPNQLIPNSVDHEAI